MDEKALQQKPLTNGKFLERVETIKANINTLSTNISRIATLHQTILSDPYDSGSSDLESLTASTQVLNTAIKDQIKLLETDAARSRGNAVKDTQVKQLKSSFQRQLQDYRRQEASYDGQYRQQIARQYAIVNPNATEAETREALEADWSDEGVFRTALIGTNRTAEANSVLGAVRARHNDIEKIERTLVELNRLIEELATTIVLQEEPVQNIEQQTADVNSDTEAGNEKLSQAVASARRARKMKWWLLVICVAIVLILALVLGLYFGLKD